jgi:tRNA threonylcarbamoyladenosine biosynthesis protein TsaE
VGLADLEREAADLWKTLPAGAVVWLSGELGAGKTTMVQAFARAAGAEPARSPTFALVHEYQSPDGTIAHVDCYRLRDPEEAVDLDLSELAGRCRLTLIEWPERAGRHAPRPQVHLRLSHDRQPALRRLEHVG